MLPVKQMKAKVGVLGESSGRSLSKAAGPPSRCSSPFPQGLEAAHAAQHQLWVVLVGVHFLIVGHESIFPLVQLLIPGSLDLLAGRREDCCEAQRTQGRVSFTHRLSFPERVVLNAWHSTQHSRPSECPEVRAVLVGMLAPRHSDGTTRG